MMNDEDFKIVSAMETYGGNFVKKLAQAFKAADSTNFQKLKNAFPEYWAEYGFVANGIAKE
jgi:hypothetical protein